MEDLEKLRFNIRHSAAHIMAEAVMNIFQEQKLELGLLHLMAFIVTLTVRNNSQKMTLKILKEMKKIIKSKRKFTGEVVSRDDAIKKICWAKLKLEIIKGIPKNEKLTIWSHESWEDICKEAMLMVRIK